VSTCTYTLMPDDRDNFAVAVLRLELGELRYAFDGVTGNYNRTGASDGVHSDAFGKRRDVTAECATWRRWCAGGGVHGSSRQARVVLMGRENNRMESHVWDLLLSMLYPEDGGSMFFRHRPELLDCTESHPQKTVLFKSKDVNCSLRPS
jgi:hypothetical protein